MGFGACITVDPLDGVDVADEDGTTGDGDPTTTAGDGDGDGDPTTGDGAPATGDGYGDGDGYGYEGTTYAFKVGECYGPDHLQGAYEGCAKQLAYDQFISPKCGTAFEEFIACLSGLNCVELTQDGSCPDESGAVNYTDRVPPSSGSQSSSSSSKHVRGGPKDQEPSSRVKYHARMVPWMLELQQRFPQDPPGVTAELRLFHFNITPEMVGEARTMAAVAQSAKAYNREMAEIDHRVDVQMQALGGSHQPIPYSAGNGAVEMLGGLSQLVVLIANHDGDPPFDANAVDIATKVLRGELPPKAALEVALASRPELARLRPMLNQAIAMLDAFDFGGLGGGLMGGVGGVLGQLFGGQRTNLVDLLIMPVVILAAPRTELYQWVVRRESPGNRLAGLRRAFSAAFGQADWAARLGRGEIATHLDHARMIAEQTPELEDDVAVIELDARLRRSHEDLPGLDLLVARLEHLVETGPIPAMLRCTGALHDAAIEFAPGGPMFERIVSLRSKLLKIADQRLRAAIPAQEWRAWAAASFEQFLAADRRDVAEAIVKAWPQRVGTNDAELARLRQRIEQGPSQAAVLVHITGLLRQMTQIQSELVENELQLGDRVERLERLVELQRQRHALLGRPDDPDSLGASISMLTMLAEGHEDLGNRRRADAVREEADALLARIPAEHPVALDARRREVAVLRMRGRYNDALLALARFGDLARSTGDLLMWARWRLDEIDLLHWLGDHTRAEDRLRETATAIEAEYPRNDSIDFASVVQRVIAEGDVEATQLRVWRIHGELCYYRGLLAHAQGRWAEAEPALRTATEIHGGLRVDSALSIELLLARNTIAGGDPERGLTHLRDLETRIQRREQLVSRLPAVWIHEARALLQLGRAREALAELLRARAHEHSVDDPELHWRLDHVEGRVRRALGQPELALACYERAIETVGRQRNTSLGWRLDTTFLRDKQPLFGEAIALAAELQEVQVSCRLVEAIKSRALSLMLRAPKVGAGVDDQQDSPLELEFDELGHQLDELENTGLRPRESHVDRERKLADLRARRSELLERLRFADPRWRMVSAPPRFDVEDCIARLGERRALQLYLDGSRIYAILVGGGELLEGRVDLDAEITQRLTTYEHNLAAPARGEMPDPLGYDLSQRLRVGAKHLIPAALLEPALRASSLIIVPHGRLHLVPWAALIYAGKRLFQRVGVAVLPNLSCLARVDEGQRRPLGAVIGAPRYPVGSRWAPLDEFADDLRAAAADYRGAGTLLTPPALHENATQELLRTLLGHPEADGGCLQIACHGDFVPDDPLRGGLQLADGKLDAASITRLRVTWADVVLSACNTGWRPDRVGELPLWGDDILGLPGALLEAGARSVLVSIPEAAVGAARRFAREFQHRRSRGSLPLAAFRATQLAMLEAQVPAWEWAGFTLYGSR